jgi:3-hydroxybutyrate dehydrogenase
VGAALAGRRALVTGGGSGIGAACARQLAADGADVMVLDLDEAAARTVAEEVGGTALAVDLTAADLSAVPADIDILVNNAGIQHVSPIEDFPPEMFERITRLMLVAPFLLVRTVLPHMYAGGWGRVVNLSSVHGLRASPYKSAYVAAKHGLEGLSKVIALEGGGKGVTSNCVCPGYVRTPLVEKQIDDQARLHGMRPDEVVERVMLTHSAVKRLVEPDEVAAMVSYLCSSAAACVNGASLTLDGGWSAQ